MSTTTIHIQATEPQLQQFERQCELNELLLSQSLCRRFQIPATQETLGIVAGWMASARSMGIVAYGTSGIQITCDDQAKPLDLGDLRQMALDLCCLIEESGASPELTKISVKASELHQAINARMP